MSNQTVYEVIDFTCDEQELLLAETLFHNANGYIGVRNTFEEGYPNGFTTIPGQYINGFYDFAPAKQAESLYGLVEEKQTMLCVANTQPIKLFLDGEAFSMFDGEVISSRRWVDMDAGVTGRYIHWRSPGGKEVKITIVRMTSLHQLSLFTIDYAVESVNFSGEVRIESSHLGKVSNFFDPNDPRTADELHQYLTPVSCDVSNGVSSIVSHTSRSHLSVCSCVSHDLPYVYKAAYMAGEDRADCAFSCRIRAGETLRFVKYATFADSLRSSDVRAASVAEMEKARNASLPDLYAHQRAFLHEYWQGCRVEIVGNELMNTALKYNMYQMLQSVSKDEHGNIAAKGLSGEGYEGHYFWDSEMYIQPFFTITNPRVTKQLIAYRYTTLGPAKENARILGHEKGALYPWRTITGSECSGYYPSGSAQYHINGDIAYSIVAYYLATKDEAFVCAIGAEIIFETARLWIDTGNFLDGAFHINDVTGPDEYTCIVNNNYYTNVLAQYHLRWAVKLYERFVDNAVFADMVSRIELTFDEITEFACAAEQMVLPYDETLGINPQDDSFLQKKQWDTSTIPKDKYPLLLHYHPLHLYRRQICKQPDTVLAHFILEDAQAIETIRNSFNYYEQITTHDSSLSGCIFSIVAAKLRLEDKAVSYFGNSTMLDLLDMHHNTKDGIHTANMGGNYMAIVYGFGGFRLKERGISLAPMLPKKWTAYRFAVRYEDSRILVAVCGDSVMITLEEGSEKQIWLYEKAYTLRDTLTIARR